MSPLYSAVRTVPFLLVALLPMRVLGECLGRLLNDLSRLRDTLSLP